MRENGNLKGTKREGLPGRSAKRLQGVFEVGGFVAQKGLWNIANKMLLEDRGPLPREDVDLLCDYQAMHEENFLSSWLREDVKVKIT